MRDWVKVLVWAVISWSATARAGSADNFAACSKSNECKSQQCFDHVCKPSMSWNGHGAVGAQCDNDSNCASHSCKSRKCVAPAAAAAQPQQQRGGSRPAPAPLPSGEVTEASCRVELKATYHQSQADIDDICPDLGEDAYATTKDLLAHGYGKDFHQVFRSLGGAPPEELACGKRLWDHMSQKERDEKGFDVPNSCWAEVREAMKAKH